MSNSNASLKDSDHNFIGTRVGPTASAIEEVYINSTGGYLTLCNTNQNDTADPLQDDSDTYNGTSGGSLSGNSMRMRIEKNTGFMNPTVKEEKREIYGNEIESTEEEGAKLSGLIKLEEMSYFANCVAEETIDVCDQKIKVEAERIVSEESRVGVTRLEVKQEYRDNIQVEEHNTSTTFEQEVSDECDFNRDTPHPVQYMAVCPTNESK